MTSTVGRPDVEALERNLDGLPLFTIASSWLPWQPIIALFITESFGIDKLLTLTAIMYFGVVLAEVPSGWMSDRVGRVITLRVASVLWIVGHSVLLLSAGSFFLIAVGQVLLASGFAFLSGTDVSFHYDTLEALGMEDSFEVRQARLKSFAYVAVALSSVLGGVAGLVDLRLAFGLSLITAIYQLVLIARFSEPPRGDTVVQPDFGHQLRACAHLVRKPLLRWIAGYWVAMVVLEHVAHTLAQPYITEALGKSPDELGATPLVVGLIFASFGIGGALAAAATPLMREKLGFFGVLLALAIISAAIVTTMAIVIALPVALLLVFRSVQGAAAPIVLTTAVAPAVPQTQRATYLSLHSLVGRLSYGALLIVVGRTVGDSLTDSLWVLTAVSWVLIVLILVAWFAGQTSNYFPSTDQCQASDGRL